MGTEDEAIVSDVYCAIMDTKQLQIADTITDITEKSCFLSLMFQMQLGIKLLVTNAGQLKKHPLFVQMGVSTNITLGLGIEPRIALP